MLVMFAALVAILVVSSGLRAQAQLYDPNEPGSVLVFPKFVRGTVAAGEPATEIEISVHCPAGLNVDGFCTLPVPGTNVRMEGHWVCPGQFSTSICKENDFFITTTIEGTVSFNTEGSAVGTNFATVRVPAAPCPEGFLVLWAVDNVGRPINFNGLLGVAEVRWNSHAAGSYEAIAIQAVGASAPTPALISTTVSPLTGHASLPFDGAAGHYAEVPSNVLATIKYDTDTGSAPSPDASSTTSLVLLTLDTLSNLPNNPVFTDLNFFDANENLVSEETNYVCWVEEPVSSIDPYLVRENLTRKGFFYSVDAFKVGLVANDTTGTVTQLGLIDTVECPANAATTGTCAPLTVPVTASNNPSITNHYMYRTDDDSVGVPTTYVP